MPVLKLRGCTPEPLGNYLKGLGVFRLIAEQADPLARAWWKDGVLCLHTRWSLDDVADFFVKGIGEDDKPIYSPTPIFAPWGGSPGFYADGDENPKKLIAMIRQSSQERLSASREAVKDIDAILQRQAWATVPKKQRKHLKSEIVASMRLAWGAHAVDWFDACVSLEENAHYGFLYGTGGNEGRADITNNFWEMIEETIGLSSPRANARETLCASIFGGPRVGGTSKTAGQHFPLAAGSSNCGQEFFGSSSANPWDVILMMEGAILFAGAATKRLSQYGKGKAAFPFMIDYLATGEPSTSINDEAKQDGQIVRCRAEFWMPLWQSATSLPEIHALLSEGRLQRRSGEKTEHTLHAMEAIKTLGSSRGIETFHRVGLFERRGKGYYLASSLGFHATSGSSHSIAPQLAEIEDFRQQIYLNLRSGPGIPDRIMRSRQRFHAALATLLEGDEKGAVSTSDALLGVLAGASTIEREIALLKDRSQILKPCPTLTNSWLPNHGRGPEYALARAVAGILPWGESSSGDGQRPAVESIRANLLPVARQGRSWVWDKTTRCDVWARGAPLHANLAATLRRRLIDAQRGGGEGLPLWSSHGARFEDLLAFWKGTVDDLRLGELIQTLSLVDADESNGDSIEIQQGRAEPTPDLQTGAVWFNPDGQAQTRLKPVERHQRELVSERELQSAFELPRVYHLLKLCFVGGRLPRRPVERCALGRSGAEPFPTVCLDLLSLVEAGRVSEAVQLAARRLGAKGYPPVLREPDMQALEMDLNQCRRLAGMLLIPVFQPGVLAALAIKPEYNS